MSHQNVVRFMEKLLSDEEFKSQVFSLESQEEGGEVQTLMDYAAEAGFSFTEAELDELFLAAAAREAQGELSAEELQTVAGGTDLASSTQLIQQAGMTFNLQFLDLQQELAAQSRQFTLMSNIMKVKHDTAQTSINNIR